LGLQLVTLGEERKTKVQLWTGASCENSAVCLIPNFARLPESNPAAPVYSQERQKILRTL
jgi:hypothetical protein